MNPREKKLAYIFLALLAVTLIGAGAVTLTRNLPGSYAERRIRLQEMKNQLQFRDLWEARDRWLSENIPSYSSETAASAHLVELVSDALKNHQVRVESQEIKKSGEPDSDDRPVQNSDFERIVMSLEISGKIKNIVECIHDLQTPPNFIGVDRLILQPAGDSGFTARLTIAHWYSTSSPD